MTSGAEVVATAVLLLLSGVAFGGGASIPLFGEHGEPRIYTLPEDDYLAAIGRNVRAWRWANVAMGSAVVLLTLGLAALSVLLADAGAPVLASLAGASFLVAAITWVVFSAYRATVPVRVARDRVRDGRIPTYYSAVGEWAGVLFKTYAVVGFLSLAFYGAGIVVTGLVPVWAGWATIVFGLGLLAHLLIAGDTLPAFHYMPPLLIAVLLLRGG
jgi:hypothetical protein